MIAAAAAAGGETLLDDSDLDVAGLVGVIDAADGGLATEVGGAAVAVVDGEAAVATVDKAPAGALENWEEACQNWPGAVDLAVSADQNESPPANEADSGIAAVAAGVVDVAEDSGARERTAAVAGGGAGKGAVEAWHTDSSSTELGLWVVHSDRAIDQQQEAPTVGPGVDSFRVDWRLTVDSARCAVGSRALAESWRSLGSSLHVPMPGAGWASKNW